MPVAISLTNLIPSHKQSKPLNIAIKLLDRVLGIKHMDRLYQQNQMAGLNKEAFAEKLLKILNIDLEGVDQVQNRVPRTGPVVIASNHPFGGVEGVILCLILGQVRPDLKVLANQGLRLFPELQDYFIFTNPLSERDPKNGPSLRASLRHVKQGGALLIFPSGRVSYYRQDKGRVSEHEWNRVVASLINKSNAQYLPLFVGGFNSPWFYRLGRIYYRLRMLMLARELLNKRGSKVLLSAGQAVKANRFATGADLDQQAAICRGLSYAQDPAWRHSWPANNQARMQPLAEEADGQGILAETAALPAEQHLLDYKDYAVYFGYQRQLPDTVREIARLREKVFRAHNEGSGAPLDTDGFDATYTHLFIIQRQLGRIIGAYRMGQTDRLLAQGGIEQLYLSRMFAFDKHFVNQQQPCLEMGRSFLIPEYQGSYQGLFLLWRGIGAFACRFPQYRTLYGTVSLSKLYDPRSVALIKQALISPTDKVSPFTEFTFALHPELQELAAEYPLKEHLSAFLASIESDGKDIPILAKQYLKLGAKFHSLGIDSNFNDTPGLLLSVDLSKAPKKLLKLYLADGWQDYVAYSG